MAILITCVGRRVELVHAFRRAGRQLKLDLLIVGSDINRLAPGLWVCDRQVISKRINQRGYIKQLLEIVRQHKVKAVIPTIDTELKILAENRSRFVQAGARVLVSSPEVIGICQDKRKTHRFLLRHGFDSPMTISARQAAGKTLKFPVFLKPWDGSASRDNVVAKSRTELDFYSRRIANCIVQQVVVGQEYTCDAYVDLNMKVRCVVPRKRIETRAGEVSKGQTVKHAEMMQQSKRLVEVLGAGPGVVTIQCFLTGDQKIIFIEINPRFGGGVPLSIKAGANFPKWILQELSGAVPRIGFDRWKDNLCMLRYDHAVWLS